VGPRRVGLVDLAPHPGLGERAQPSQ
jgi:hypothetical protein